MNAKAKQGRPTAYTPEIAQEICELLATGISLNKACAAEHLPHPTTVRRWVFADINGFSQQYARAREMQHQAFADEMVDLASEEPRYILNTITNEKKIDPSFEQWRKTKIAALQWSLSKILYKEYGERTQHDVNVSVNPSQLSDADLARIAARGLTITGECETILQPAIASR